MAAANPARILVVFGDENRRPLGTYWQFTAKKTDFYLEPRGSGFAGAHLSAHGPKEGFSDHRFHVTIREHDVKKAQSKGHFVAHGLPPGGQPMSGRRVANRAFLVSRMRWMPLLRDTTYEAAARPGSEPPQLGDNMSGAVLRAPLPAASAWDLDVFVSYDEPYWPPMTGPTTGDPRLGPLANDASMFLTVVSTARALDKTPHPPDLLPAVPGPDEAPNRLLCGGLDPAGDIYWWVETITARELLQASSSHHP